MICSSLTCHARVELQCQLGQAQSRRTQTWQSWLLESGMRPLLNSLGRHAGHLGSLAHTVVLHKTQWHYCTKTCYMLQHAATFYDVVGCLNKLFRPCCRDIHTEKHVPRWQHHCLCNSVMSAHSQLKRIPCGMEKVRQHSGRGDMCCMG